MELEGLPTERTLGYPWNCQLDTFLFQLKPNPEAIKKRVILAAVSSIFDPIGFLAPVVIVAKILG